MRTTLRLLAFLLFTQALTAASDPPPFPGKKTAWHGHDHYAFSLDTIQCRVVTPKKAAPGKPWIWRARFFGHEPQTDIALLARGFHVAYCNVAGLYGSPRAVARWNTFYDYLTARKGLSSKPALEGMSRGGLIIYNWAIKNPGKMSCIYGDAPVCDFKSWPGPGKWGACLKAYGLTDQEAMSYPGNPVDSLAPLALAGVPLLHVCGGADKVVPVSENTAILEKNYKALGGMMTTIIKKGVGHHPHSLKNPKPIVDFILHHTETPDFESRLFCDTSGKSIPYRLLKPKSMAPSTLYPLVVFFHGAGERGVDNRRPLVHVVDIFTTPANRTHHPCYVLAPQCPPGQQWVDKPWGALSHTINPEPSTSMSLVLALIKKLEAGHPIDSQRIYVMGLSMGGYATWDIISRFHGRFAAAVPMCGGADEGQAPRLTKIPIWNFHGGRDNVVKTIRSRNIIDAIRKAGGKPRYTEYPQLGHNCWSAASREPDLLPWLFSKRAAAAVR